MNPVHAHLFDRSVSTKYLHYRTLSQSDFTIVWFRPPATILERQIVIYRRKYPLGEL